MHFQNLCSATFYSLEGLSPCSPRQGFMGQQISPQPPCHEPLWGATESQVGTDQEVKWSEPGSKGGLLFRDGIQKDCGTARQSGDTDVHNVTSLSQLHSPILPFRLHPGGPLLDRKNCKVMAGVAGATPHELRPHPS